MYKALILFLDRENEGEPFSNLGCTFSQLTIDDSIIFKVSLICCSVNEWITLTS